MFPTPGDHDDRAEFRNEVRRHFRDLTDKIDEHAEKDDRNHSAVLERADKLILLNAELSQKVAVHLVDGGSHPHILERLSAIERRQQAQHEENNAKHTENVEQLQKLSAWQHAQEQAVKAFLIVIGGIVSFMGLVLAALQIDPSKIPWPWSR